MRGLLRRLWWWILGRRYFRSVDLGGGADFSCEVTGYKDRNGTVWIESVTHIPHSKEE